MFNRTAPQDADGGPARPGLWRTMAIAAVTAALVAPTAVWASHPGGFNDVPDSNIFHDDIDWLADADVTKGCNPPDNDEFCPDDFVTREQMAAFMRRLAENQVVDAGEIGGTPAAQVLAGVNGRLGYAWACSPGSASYDPVATCGFSHNSSGGDITITKSAMGRYRVTFEDLGAANAGGHVQVTAYGAGATSCKVLSWGSVDNASVNVRCFDVDGNAADEQFDVMFVY